MCSGVKSTTFPSELYWSSSIVAGNGNAQVKHKHLKIVLKYLSKHTYVLYPTNRHLGGQPCSPHEWRCSSRTAPLWRPLSAADWLSNHSQAQRAHQAPSAGRHTVNTCGRYVSTRVTEFMNTLPDTGTENTTRTSLKTNTLPHILTQHRPNILPSLFGKDRLYSQSFKTRPLFPRSLLTFQSVDGPLIMILSTWPDLLWTNRWRRNSSESSTQPPANQHTWLGCQSLC